jgi:steroid delta-isomerase-like uncharacterized protein
MASDPNEMTARRYYEAVLNGRDLSILDLIAVPAYVEHDPLPGQGDGVEGLKGRATMLLDAFDPHFTIEDVVMDGDKVVVRWTQTGTHVGEFLGIPPTGRTFRIAGIDIHRLEDSRLAEHWHVVDQLALFQQLGLVPGPEAAHA